MVIMMAIAATLTAVTIGCVTRAWAASSRGAATAFTAICLDGRAGHGAKGAEHAAIARVGAQQHTTAFALVEILAGIGWHCLGRLEPAMRAGER